MDIEKARQAKLKLDLETKERNQRLQNAIIAKREFELNHSK